MDGKGVPSMLDYDAHVNELQTKRNPHKSIGTTKTATLELREVAY
jgi:hypothetical protein